MHKAIIAILRLLKTFLVKQYLPDKLDLTKTELIKSAKISDLKDVKYLEFELIPNLGLNNEILTEFPIELFDYTGKGLFIWQYPKQLAEYLVFLSKFPITRFIEIGPRWGGNFILQYEYLSRFNKDVEATCVDIVKSKSLEKYSKINSKLEYLIMSSNSDRFRNLLNDEQFDLAFIDGDHSFDGCYSDYEFFKNRADILVFHDIVSDVCPGVVLTWKLLKESKSFECFEFVSQYDEVVERTKHNYLGIGVAINKKSKYISYVK
jgi:cephalosporin hydroxylase